MASSNSELPLDSPKETGLSSIFELACTDCRLPLIPFQGSIWACGHCHRQFEVCGNYLIELPSHEKSGAGTARAPEPTGREAGGRPARRLETPTTAL